MANPESRPDSRRTTIQDEPPSPVSHKPMTAGQQVLLTIKVVAGAGVVIALIWFIDSIV